MAGTGPWPCTTCGGDINAGDKFCIACGVEYNSLNCSGCNAPLTVGFDCNQCGTVLDWDLFFGVEKPSPPAPSQPPPHQPPPNYGYPDPPQPIKGFWSTLLGKAILAMLAMIGLGIVITVLGALIQVDGVGTFGISVMVLGIILLVLTGLIIIARGYLRLKLGR